MIFITNHTQLSKCFADFCRQYHHFKWAVAWAGREERFDLAGILNRNKHKIERLIVGLHFCQTDPLFIERHMDNPCVRFMKNAEGIFHPKMYFFYNSSNDWSAIVGSSNFTFSAFNNNSEANVCFNQDDGNGLFKQLNQYVESIWEQANSFSPLELDRYKRLFDCQKRRLDSLRKLVVNNKSRIIEAAEIDVMTWDSYMSSVRREDSAVINARISLLNDAKSVFSRYSSFNDIPVEYRKCLAGFAEKMPGSEGIDWRLFGSMQGAGRFKNEINSGSAVAHAIDMIPLKGEISRSQFDQYCKVFKSVSKNPLACATRLLAIKRPDVFVCVDSKNKKNLCKAFGIPQSHLTLDTYWEMVVERVKRTVWFEEEVKGQDKDIKKYQVAMLDSFYYQNE